MFRSPEGGPLRHGNFMSRHYHPAVERLVANGAFPEELQGLRFHDLRHTAATLMLSKGVHPKIVSEMLGHGDVAFTLTVYSHVLKGMQKGATQAIDEALGGG